MHEFDHLRQQMRECGDCLKAFLVKTVERQPELTEHAGIVREHLEALRRELEVLADRMP
jgi:hypothetical protein